VDFQVNREGFRAGGPADGFKEGELGTLENLSGFTQTSDQLPNDLQLSLVCRPLDNRINRESLWFGCPQDKRERIHAGGPADGFKRGGSCEKPCLSVCIKHLPASQCPQLPLIGRPRYIQTVYILFREFQ
jgi:hypothetical protein